MKNIIHNNRGAAAFLAKIGAVRASGRSRPGLGSDGPALPGAAGSAAALALCGSLAVALSAGAAHGQMFGGTAEVAGFPGDVGATGATGVSGPLFPGQEFDVGDGPESVAIGDLDGDGIPDLAVANRFSSSVSILLGIGDGTFQNHQQFGVSNNPSFVAIGDLDGDGIPDLAVAIAGEGSNPGKAVSVHLGNGDGTFQGPQEFDVGYNPLSIAIGDLNVDGVPDLAVANSTSNSVSVLLGVGDGTFLDHQEFPVGDFVRSVAIGDLDGDGSPDLAVTLSGGVVSVLLGVGDGTLQTPQDFPVTMAPRSVVIGDLDGDGVLDLAVAGTLLFGDDPVSIMLGVGDGTFQAEQQFPIGSDPQLVAIGDLNGDGIPDLTVASGSESNAVSVLLGVGDGTFQERHLYDAGIIPMSVAIGDVDGDGVPDLAVANLASDTITVLIGAGDGTFQAQRQSGVGFRPASVAIGDLDGDGVPDLAVANSGSGDNTVSVLLGVGDGMFQDHQQITVGSMPRSVAIGDLDGDGVPDLAVANSSTSNNTVSILLGVGDGTFQEQQLFPVGGGSRSVAIGDLDGDGIPDLVVANSGGFFPDSTVSVLLGLGDGTFQAHQLFDVGLSPVCVAIGDLNADGVPDLAVANLDADTISTLLGVGDGTFQAQHQFEVGSSPRSVSIGDLDGDGIPDLAVANFASGSNSVSVLLGVGDGTFHEHQEFAAGVNPASVSIGDLDGDGVPDLAVANGGGDARVVSVLFGVGDGTFQTPQQFGARFGPEFLAIGDLNGDGALDLAVANRLADTVSVLINQSAATSNPADFNGDGEVNGADLAILLANWGSCPPSPDPCPADLNTDDEVNGADLAILLANWGTSNG